MKCARRARIFPAATAKPQPSQRRNPRPQHNSPAPRHPQPHPYSPAISQSPAPLAISAIPQRPAPSASPPASIFPGPIVKTCADKNIIIRITLGHITIPQCPRHIPSHIAIPQRSATSVSPPASIFPGSIVKICADKNIIICITPHYAPNPTHNRIPIGRIRDAQRSGAPSGGAGASTASGEGLPLGRRPPTIPATMHL